MSDARLRRRSLYSTRQGRQAFATLAIISSRRYRRQRGQKASAKLNSNVRIIFSRASSVFRFYTAPTLVSVMSVICRSSVKMIFRPKISMCEEFVMCLSYYCFYFDRFPWQRTIIQLLKFYFFCQSLFISFEKCEVSDKNLTTPLFHKTL